MSADSSAPQSNTPSGTEGIPPEQAALMLGVSITTIANYVRDGYKLRSGDVLPIRRFPGVVSGKARFVLAREDVERIQRDRTAQ